MGNNTHLKRYSVLNELKSALSGEKIKSPGIAVLEDGSVYYDQELKRIWPDYKINTGSYNYDEPTPTEFIIDKEFYYIPLEGGNFKLNIKSNKPWICEYDSSVCKILPSKGDSNKSININCFSCEENRDINISFYVENEKVAEFPIYQYAYEDTPLTFEIITGGQIFYGCSSEYTYNDTIQYSINGKSWKTSNSIQKGIYIDVNSDDKVFIKGNSKNPKTVSNYTYFGNSSSTYNISGNIGSLFDDDWNNYMYDYCCFSLFNSNSSLINVKNLILPATILAQYCYSEMFYYCTLLINAPELISTILNNGCYTSMFEGCTSLITAPSLQATTLAQFCYSNMFNSCTSLVNVSELPAIILADCCYQGMFSGCTSLYSAPQLPATNLAQSCYYRMFSECTSLYSAPELPATTLKQFCYSFMFFDCTSLVYAPKLIATTLVDNCYSAMFKGCISLINAPELPATTLVYHCYLNMFMGCTNLNYIKCLATNINDSYSLSATNYWLDSVASSGIFIKNNNVDWSNSQINNVKGAIPSGWTVYNESDYEVQPLTFEILEDGEIQWRFSNPIGVGYSSSNYKRLISYNKNNTGWISIWSDNIGNNGIQVNRGDIIQFKGNNSNYVFTSSSTYGSYFSTTCKFNVYGNIMSLINETDYIKLKTLSNTNKYIFFKLFNNCINLISAQNLILPATKLTDYCYSNMFAGCSSLTTTPILPATTLANYCYINMFNGCTSLTIAPELPAMILAEGCYSNMFNGCTSLTTAPSLPATTLAKNCYSHMFAGCSSLTTAPALPATTLANYCYINMFNGCTSLTIAPELPAMILAEGCYQYMFSDCTSLTSAPVLLAITLVDYCYKYMFYRCTRLNYIKCLATNISATECLNNWVSNVSSTGIFIKNNNNTSWPTGNNGIQIGWTVYNEVDIYINDKEILLSSYNNYINIIKIDSNNPTIKISNRNTPWSITSNSQNLTFSSESGNSNTDITITISGTISNLYEIVEINGLQFGLTSILDSGKYYKDTFNITSRILTGNTYSCKIDMDHDEFLDILLNHSGNIIYFNEYQFNITKETLSSPQGYRFGDNTNGLTITLYLENNHVNGFNFYCRKDKPADNLYGTINYLSCIDSLS